MRVRAERDLELAITGASPDATFVLDAEGTLIWANAACERVLGWSRHEIVDRNVLDFAHPDDAALVLSSLDSVQTKGVGTPIEVRTRNPAGEWRSLEIIGRDCLADPAIAGIICTARDLTDRRMWEVARGDDERLQWVVQHVPAVVLLLDDMGVITSANGAMTRLLGHDPSKIVGRPLVDFAADETERSRLETALLATTSHVSGTVEVMMASAGGRPPVPIRLEIVDLLDDAVMRSVAVTGHDITELHEARGRLEHMAGHDALTDLPNRSVLGRHLGALLAARRPLALLYVDLDRFKPVNDRYGHGAGDLVLRCVAQRLVATVSASDIVSRIGGDEFVVLAVGITEPTIAVALAERIRARIEEPFDLGSATVCVGASIGVALGGPGATPDELLHEADAAMYSAKGPRSIACDLS